MWRETVHSCSWHCWPHYSFLVLGSEIKSSQTETETLASWRSLLTPPWNRETGSKGGLGWFTGFIFKYKIYLYIYIFIIFIYTGMYSSVQITKDVHVCLCGSPHLTKMCSYYALTVSKVVKDMRRRRDVKWRPWWGLGNKSSKDTFAADDSQPTFSTSNQEQTSIHSFIHSNFIAV